VVFCIAAGSLSILLTYYFGLFCMIIISPQFVTKMCKTFETLVVFILCGDYTFFRSLGKSKQNHKLTVCL